MPSSTTDTAPRRISTSAVLLYLTCSYKSIVTPCFSLLWGMATCFVSLVVTILAIKMPHKTAMSSELWVGRVDHTLEDVLLFRYHDDDKRGDLALNIIILWSDTSDELLYGQPIDSIYETT